MKRSNYDPGYGSLLVVQDNNSEEKNHDSTMITNYGQHLSTQTGIKWCVSVWGVPFLGVLNCAYNSDNQEQ